MERTDGRAEGWTEGEGPADRRGRSARASRHLSGRVLSYEFRQRLPPLGAQQARMNGPPASSILFLPISVNRKVNAALGRISPLPLSTRRARDVEIIVAIVSQWTEEQQIRSYIDEMTYSGIVRHQRTQYL